MNNTRNLAALLLAGVLILGSTPALGGGMSSNEQSAGPTGMAGAVTAIADTPSAGFYNPAGLANQTGLSVEGGVTVLLANTAYKGIAPGTDLEVEVDGTQPVFLPSGHAAYRIHDRVAAGFSYCFPFGLGATWPDSVNVDGTTTPWWGRGSVQNIALFAMSFNPNVAVKLHDRIYLGGGVTVLKGVVNMERAMTMSSDDTADIDMKLSADGWGVGGTAGVLVKVLPGWLNLGVAYRSGVNMTLKGSVAFTQQGSPDNISPGVRAMALDGPTEVDMNFPHIVSVGVAGFPVKPLTLGLGVDVETWSSYDRLNIRFPENPDLNASEPKEWHNIVAVRVGAEYRVLPYLPLRAGFIFTQNPVPAVTRGPDAPDGHRYEATAGMGYRFKGFSVDAAYQFRTSAYTDTAEGAYVDGAFRLRMHIVSATLGYRADI